MDRPYTVDPVSGAWIFPPTPEERIAKLEREVADLRELIKKLTASREQE